MSESLIQETNITDCALQLISVKMWFEESLLCLTGSSVEVTVQVATKAQRIYLPAIVPLCGTQASFEFRKSEAGGYEFYPAIWSGRAYYL